jgi:hypothetical protein
MKARLARVFERAAKFYRCFNLPAYYSQVVLTASRKGYGCSPKRTVHPRTTKKEAGLKFCERGTREAEQIVKQKGAKDQKRYNDDDGCDGMDRREPC